MPDTESLLSTSEVLKILNVPSYKLDYLFKSRKLKPEEFTTLKGSRHRVYRHSDLAKIKEALFEVSAR
jgi:DNA-binding transcriptional MerR regulator